MGVVSSSQYLRGSAAGDLRSVDYLCLDMFCKKYNALGQLYQVQSLTNKFIIGSFDMNSKDETLALFVLLHFSVETCKAKEKSFPLPSSITDRDPRVLDVNNQFCTTVSVFI